MRRLEQPGNHLIASSAPSGKHTACTPVLPAHLGTLSWDAVLPPANPLRLTRVFTRASDRQICHLVTVTSRDGLPAHVPLTPGHLKLGQSIPQTELKEPYWHQA